MDWKRLLAAAIMATCLATPAWAGRMEDWTACHATGNGKDVIAAAIAGCTARIQSGTESTTDMELAYLARGSLHLRSGQQTHAAAAFDLALADYDQAIALSPNYEVAYVRRGYAYLQLQQPQKAVGDFQQAVRLQPRDARAWLFLGATQGLLGQPEDAIRSFGQSAAVLPSADAYVGLGEEYLRGARLKEAQAVLTQALELEPGNAEALGNRCWARAQLGQELDAAMADCNRAIAARPDTAAFLDSRALVRFRQGDYAAAVADCDRALALVPAQHETRYLRGVARLKLGDASGNADISAARAALPAVTERYAAFGVAP